MINYHTICIIVVISLVTAILRFLPFILFNENRKTPKIIEKLGKFLPFAIMGMLVVFCLKDLNFTCVSNYMPQLIACVIVFILHVWRRNTLISIIGGTVSYMLLVQLVF